DVIGGPLRKGAPDRFLVSRPLPCFDTTRLPSPFLRFLVSYTVPFFEAVTLAFAQIRAQKLKSFFTLIGVTIGVMFLIAIVSTVEGMGNYVEHDLLGKLVAKNSSSLRQRPSIQVGDVDRAERRRWYSRPPITEDDVAAVSVALPRDTRFMQSRDGALTL